MSVIIVIYFQPAWVFALNGGHLGRHGLPTVDLVHLECQEGRSHGSWDFMLELEHSQSNLVMSESVSH